MCQMVPENCFHRVWTPHAPVPHLSHPDAQKGRRAGGPRGTRQPGPPEGDAFRALTAHVYAELTPRPAGDVHWKTLH